MTNEQLAHRIRAGENEAENMLALWQQNTGFINKMALKYSGYAEMDDLNQEGYIGLCEAVRHYETDSGVPFINYAAFWIKQTMQRYIKNCVSVVRIPVHAQQEVSDYKRVLNEYRKYYGKEPSDREMRHFLHVSEEKLDKIKKAVQMGQIRSLSEPIGAEDDCTLEDSVASVEDMEEDCIRRMDRERMSQQLWIEVDKLPEKQAELIRWRYQQNKTLKESGEVLGISIEQVRQIQSKAIRTLRLPRRCGKFRAYHEAYLSAAPIHHVGRRSFETTWTSEVEREVMRRYAES